MDGYQIPDLNKSFNQSISMEQDQDDFSDYKPIS